MSFRNRSATVSATFHLTHACNLRCTYCYTGEKTSVGMSRETAQRAVEFCLAQAGRDEAEHLEIVFFGGEPLLKHSLLCEIVDLLRASAGAMRVSFKMSTNGLLLTETVVDDLARQEVFISLSLDGDPATQNAQRPDAAGRGSADRLVPVFRRLLAWNQHTAVNCVVTPESAGRLDENVRWIFSQGFRYVTTPLDWSAGWSWGHLESLAASYQRLGEWYVAETLRGRKFYVSCFDEKIRSRTRGPLDKSERCMLGVRQFSIAPSGRLYPCVQFVKEDDDPEWQIGDIERGFDEAKRECHFQHAETGARSECGGCALQPRCSSWCACVNWAAHGRTDEPAPLVCEHERLLTPIADHVANQLWRRRSAHFLHKHYNPAFPVLSFVEDALYPEASHAER